MAFWGVTFAHPVCWANISAMPRSTAPAAVAERAVRRHRSAGTSSRDFRTHRRPKFDVVHCDNCSAFILEFAMNDVVERILNTYQTMSPLDAERAVDSREKISRYIESLASAGQRDAEQLAIYGLAYLTELHEGQDPRFTGC
jgi:hypothetical protein